MNYHLGAINDIQKDLSKDLRGGKAIQQEQLKHLTICCEQLMLAFLHGQSDGPVKKVRTVFRQQQHELLLMCDMAEGLKESEIQNRAVGELSYPEQFQEIILGLLDEMQIRLPYLWSYSFMVPRVLLKRFVNENRILLKGVLKDMTDKGYPNKLVDFIYHLYFSLAEGCATISFYQLNYLKELINVLSDELKGRVTENQRYCYNLLILCNLNSPEFYGLCRDSLFAQGDINHPVQERIVFLIAERKSVRQMSLMMKKPYISSSPSLDKMLLSFIDEEIVYLRELQHIGTDLTGSALNDNSFKVSFSVKQLAFFIHLQVESGIILEQRPKQIHLHSVNHYSTEDRLQISEKSFKNAYYSHADEDIKRVSAKLSEMLAIAQEIV